MKINTNGAILLSIIETLGGIITIGFLKGNPYLWVPILCMDSLLFSIGIIIDD